MKYLVQLEHIREEGGFASWEGEASSESHAVELAREANEGFDAYDVEEA